MNTKHTLGPWRVDGNGIKALVRAESSGVIVAVRHRQPAAEHEANARLIAAAPELLDALVWMVENDETNEGDTPMPDLDGATWNEINAYWINGLNRARAAIAKATGEQA